MGAQSFNTKHLKTLERHHDPRSVFESAERAHRAGFDRLSIDLIYAIPDQTLAQWEDDLKQAFELPIDHLSAYALTYEPNTAMTARLNRGDFQSTPDELEVDMYNSTLDAINAHGMQRYEVSNHAKPGSECKHNIAYWRNENWLAIGPSASGHLDGYRWKNTPRLDEYISTNDAGFAPICDLETPDPKRSLMDTIMMGIRVRDGLDEQQLINAAGKHSRSTELNESIQDCIKQGWIESKNGQILLTDDGYHFADRVARDLIGVARSALDHIRDRFADHTVDQLLLVPRHQAIEQRVMLMHQPVNDLHRIIDANLNRASEGLRVLEDIARFSLNHSSLSERIKVQRHLLRKGIGSLKLDQTQLLNARDTEHDVGTSIQTPTESSRLQGTSDIASAASKRAQEALRSIEEAAKGLGCSGADFETIRYALYDIERDLLLLLLKGIPDWPLCILISEELCLHKSIREVVRDIARAGARCIQIREKTMSGRDFLEHATKLTTLAHDHGLSVIINDRIDIALICNADGVHLGQDDFPINTARTLLGPSKYIGRSCSTIKQLREAFVQGADYCGLGPIFPSTTKVKPNLLGVGLLNDVMRNEDLKDRPMLAISGINTDTIDQVVATGFPGVAVSSAVCSTEDPYEACKLLMDKLLNRESCGV
ncbi:thiE [Symbiodinium sp. CCMP2592]|nr:thiE [Symbiodinium sp. CCMP2592]